MNYTFRTTFFLILLTKESIPLCAVVNILPPMSNYGYWPKTEGIQCRNEVISSDFAAKVIKLAEMHPLHSLEIIDGNNPEIPSDVFKLLRNIPALRINNAGVRTIQPGAFNGLRILKQLSLKYNRIELLNENCFANLSMLTDLDLSFNKIVSIHSKSFANLTRLRVLFLQNNLIAELPPELFRDQTNWLRVLDLSFNKLLTVKNESFSHLTYLSTIYLNNNKLNSLESNVFKTEKLTQIHINNNELKSLILTLPTAIEFLNASHNLIESISFSGYTVIPLLDLSSNGLESANDLKFGNAIIRHLNLDQNYFDKYPSKNQTAFFSNLVALESLSLSNNNLQQLSRNVFTYNQYLTKLNLTGNYLRNSDFLNFLPNLQYLNVSFNDFNSNNINFSVLKYLKNLDVSFNSLDQIRYNVLVGLKFLGTLNLSHNKISKISLGCFRDLQMLDTLDMSNNKISSLELGVFGGLTRLSELDLSHNGLIQLKDETFHNLKFLHVLNLRNSGVSYTVVENIMSHSSGLTNIDLAENNWSCTLLIKFLKKYGKVKLFDARNYNTANVHGVACIDEVEDVADLVNTESKDFSDFKLASKHISFTCKKGQKEENDQELHLVSDC